MRPPSASWWPKPQRSTKVHGPRLRRCSARLSEPCPVRLDLARICRARRAMLREIAETHSLSACRQTQQLASEVRTRLLFLFSGAGLDARPFGGRASTRQKRRGPASVSTFGSGPRRQRRILASFLGPRQQDCVSRGEHANKTRRKLSLHVGGLALAHKIWVRPKRWRGAGVKEERPCWY